MKVFKKILCTLLVVVMCLTSAPLIGFDYQVEASEYKDGDIIQYGTYPKSRVQDSKLIAKLDTISKTWKSYGRYTKTGTYVDWYKCTDFFYEGSKYRAIMLSNYYSGYESSNGYSKNTTYYFKYAPLSWKVLDASTGLIICNEIIDCRAYQDIVINIDEDYWQDSSKTVYASDYSKSFVREWMNTDFYQIAFTKTQKDNIKITDIDTEGSKYVSISTSDKMFLISYDDANDLLNSSSRDRYGTDYSKCLGLHRMPGNLYGWGVGQSWWWLRTPYNSNETRTVYDDGAGGGSPIRSYYVDNTSIGVVPACCLIELKNDSSVNSEIFTEGNSIRETFSGTLESTTISVELNGDKSWVSEITVDGRLYPVHDDYNLWSATEYKGKTVVVTTENNKVIFCQPKETVKSWISATFNTVPSKIQYTKDGYNSTAIGISLRLTNAFSSAFLGTKEDAANFSELDTFISKVTLKSSNPELISFDGEAECELTDVRLAHLKAGEFVRTSCNATINQDYKMTEETESVEISYLVEYANEASIKRCSGSKTIRIENKSYEPNEPEKTELSNLDGINEVINKLNKYSNAISLDQLWTNGILTKDQVDVIAAEYLLKIVMTTAPEDSYETKIAEAAMKKIFGEFKPAYGMYTKTVEHTVFIESEKYGPLEIRIYSDVSKFNLDDTDFASFSSINYEIVDGDRKNEIPEYYQSGSAGMAVTADVEKFSEAAIHVADNAIKEQYDEVWGKDADKVADMLFSDLPKEIISRSKYKSFSNMVYEAMTAPTKKGWYKCPVDIYIYDSQGVLCASVVDNEVVSSCDKAHIEIIGDEKVVTLYDETYTVEIVGLGEGSMDITIEEYANLSGLIKSININEIPLDYGVVYSQKIDNDLMCDEDIYSLTNKANNDVIAVTDFEYYIHTHNLGEMITVVEPTCTEHGKMVRECDKCGKIITVFESPVGHTHTTSTNPPTCVESGSIIYSCTCGDTYNETISATGHNFNEGESKCSNCGFDKADSCSCNCHKSGFMGFIWKIVRFFWKLFRMNPICDCGATHY